MRGAAAVPLVPLERALCQQNKERHELPGEDVPGLVRFESVFEKEQVYRRWLEMGFAALWKEK